MDSIRASHGVVKRFNGKIVPQVDVARVLARYNPLKKIRSSSRGLSKSSMNW